MLELRCKVKEDEMNKELNRKRKIVRNAMLNDGFSEYNAMGLIDSETSKIWEKEFKRRFERIAK